MKYSVLAVILLSLGCTKKEPATPPSAPTDAKPAAEESPKEAAPEPESILVLNEPGSAPPRRLRWQLEAGSRKQLVWESSNYVFYVQQGAKKQTESKLPPIVQVIELTVTEVTDSGVAKISYEVLSDEVRKSSDDSVGLHITPAKGVTGAFELDSLGVLRRLTQVLPEGLSPKADLEYIENLLRLTFVQVPEQPVGIGAKWDIARSVTRRGIRMEETATVELMEIKGEVFEFAYTLNSKGAAETEVAPRGEVIGVRFEDFTWGAKGRVETALRSVAPIAATVDNDLMLNTRFEREGKPDDVLDMKVARDVVMRGK
jgi:hypothetical protein